MAIASSKTVTMSADGLTDWIPLSPGKNRVFIKSGTWSTSSVAVKVNNTDSSAHAPFELSDGTAVSAVTANRSFIAEGPGYIAGLMSSYGGTAVTLAVIDEKTQLNTR